MDLNSISFTTEFKVQDSQVTRGIKMSCSRIPKWHIRRALATGITFLLWSGLTQASAQVQMIGPTAVQGSGAIDNLTSGGVTPNGIWLAGSDMFASCPYQAGTACSGATEPGEEHKQFLSRGATNLGAKPEWPFTIDESINTGQAPAWIAGHTYTVNAIVSANSNIYTATTGGQSAASGSGPSGMGSAIQDGAAVWMYNCSAGGGCNNKLTFNATSVAGASAGPAWNASFNLVMQSGNDAKFNNTVESDISNYTGTPCSDLVKNHCVNVWLYGNGPYEMTSALLLDYGAMNFPGYTPAASTKAYIYPIWLTYGFGTLCGNACIEIDAPGPVGLEFGADNKAGSGGSVTTFSAATIRDWSQSTDGIQLRGKYSNAAIDTTMSTGSVVALEAGSNQRVCLNAVYMCQYYDALGSNTLTYTNNTNQLTIETLDNAGNLITAGSITAKGFQLDPLETSVALGNNVVIAANGQQAAGISISGAALGDFVQCSATTDLTASGNVQTAVVLSGFVVSGGLVRCVYTNPTNAQVTLSPHTLYARVTHHHPS